MEEKQKAESDLFLAEALRRASYAFGSGYPDGQLYICNQAFCDLTGYTEEELQEMSWAVDITPEEWREFEAEKLAELLRTDQPQRYEKEYFHKDGTRVPIEIETHVIRDDDGDPKWYYAFVKDISERKQATDALGSLYQISRDLNAAQDERDLLDALSRSARESGAFSAALMYIDLDESGDPAWFEVASVWQEDGDYPVPPGTRVPAPEYPFAPLFIAAPEEPQFIADVMTDERVDDSLRETLEPLSVRGMLFIPLTQANRWLGVLALAWDEPHEFGEQAREFYRAIMQLAGPAVENRRLLNEMENIVRQRTVELQDAQQLLQLVLDTIPMGIYWKDRDLAYLGCNEPFARDASIESPEEILGKSDFDLGWASEADRYHLDDRHVIDSGEARLNYEETHTMPDGSQIWLKLSKAPLHDAAGQVKGIIGVYDDISAQKRAEAERERLQQEVIEAQQQAIRELSSPVIPIIDAPGGRGGVIVMPLIGSIDTMRARDITRSLLAGIRQHRAKVVILDVTGVSMVDSGVANHLNKTVQAARLKGARTIVTGISDAVAETIVDLGIDWSGIETLADLQTGLIVALNNLGIRLISK
jgi:rsbT co-antagonist protein RsbR